MSVLSFQTDCSFKLAICYTSQKTKRKLPILMRSSFLNIYNAPGQT